MVAYLPPGQCAFGWLELAGIIHVHPRDTTKTGPPGQTKFVWQINYGGLLSTTFHEFVDHYKGVYMYMVGCMRCCMRSAAIYKGEIGDGR